MVYYTLTPRSFPNKTACAAVLHGSMFSKPCAPAQGRVPYTRAAAQAAALGLLYPDAAQVPTKPHVLRFCMVQCSQSPVRRHRGVRHTHVQPRKRLLWGYYTLTPRSGPNKTACAAVLHGSMFSKPCAPAQGRVPCTRAAAQAAALGLLYPDAAQWFPTKPHVLRFCMVQCSQSPVRRHRGVCRAHAQPRKRRLWGYYTPDAAKTKAPSPGGERGGSVQRTVVTRREMSSFSLGSGSSLIEPKGICATSR